MEMHQLRYVVAVVRAGNFSAPRSNAMSPSLR